MLRPPTERAFERILVLGGANAGKTRCWLDVARFSHRSGSDARFLVVDTDFATERMMGPATPFHHLLTEGVVDYRYVGDWQEMTEAVAKFATTQRPQDWLVIDMFSAGWEWVQNWYSEERYGKDMSSFLLAHVKSQETGNEFSGDTDWRVIKRAYKNLLTDKVIRAQGHVLATASVKDVSKRDAQVIRDTFERHGVRPESEKHTAHLFHSVLIADAGRGDWRLTSVKDRERALLAGAKVDDTMGFTLRYLVQTANWRP